MCTTLDMSYWVYGAYKTLRENMPAPNVFEEILRMRRHAYLDIKYTVYAMTSFSTFS